MHEENNNADTTATPEAPKKRGRPKSTAPKVEKARSSYEIKAEDKEGFDKFFELMDTGVSTMLTVFAKHPEEFAALLEDAYRKYSPRKSQTGAKKVTNMAERLKNQLSADQLELLVAQLKQQQPGE